jgi:DNA-binding MarR family transcriptional regulator
MSGIAGRSGRHPLPSNERKYEIGHLYAINKEILRRLAIGQKPKDIASALGIARQTVSNTANSELGRAHMSVLQVARDANSVDISRAILETTPESLAILQEIQSNEDTPRALKASVAFGILDRAGYGKTKKTVVDIHGDGGALVTEKMVEEMKVRAIKEGKMIRPPSMDDLDVEDAVIVTPSQEAANG